jgi:hypothetical protein
MRLPLQQTKDAQKLLAMQLKQSIEDVKTDSKR